MGTLANETKYYWKIIARDSYGDITEGQVQSFYSGYIDPVKYTVALWHFDEDQGSLVEDETVYKNNGTITGETWTDGIIGNALYFDGSSSDRVVVQDSPSLDITGTFSINARIIPDYETGSNYRVIVDKFQYVGPDSKAYGYTFYINNDGKLRFTLYGGNDGNKNVQGTTPNIRDGNPHNVSCFWNGTHIGIYLDGVLEGTTACSFPPSPTSQNLGIGKRLSGHGITSSFKGVIDDIKISCNQKATLPNNPSPPDDSIDINIYPYLNWTCDDLEKDPITYDVYYGISNPPPKVISNQSDAFYNPETLEYGTPYYWQIIAWSDPYLPSIGDIWSFETIEPQNNPPYEPINLYPEDGAIDANINTDLSWTGGDPDPGDTVTYDIYFDESPTPTTLIAEDHPTESFDPGILEYDMIYYWKIISDDGQGHSTEGDIWKFSTEIIANDPPFEPEEPDPDSGIIDVSIDIDIYWTSGDPDPGDTVTYDIYLGTSNPPPLLETGWESESYDPVTLDHDEKYYWRIVANDDHDQSTDGPIWNFTTIRDNLQPYEASDPDPENGDLDININVDLSWTGGDPDPGDTVTYDIYLGTISPSPFTSPGI